MPSHLSGTKSRRFFLYCLPVLGLASFAGVPEAIGQEALLQDGDSDAMSIDYRSDAHKVDRAKFPAFTPDQNCQSCNLYMAEKGAPSGACGIVFGKAVLAAGWCSSWEKRSG